MVKHTQIIRRQITDELFGCVWLLYGVGAERVNFRNPIKFQQSVCISTNFEHEIAF